ncbi:hypothetical protein VV02_07505 [Luteipulveratus mongoliensis]|uniref:Uncharacterized protein n=1 Tax=Luteipulveratus mongoliensis TaxID=571913 RepID=A0A0K1JG97_9MICO|nr:hypothetical protein VV02_07505 [Luteipulveratus mongoliensis]
MLTPGSVVDGVGGHDRGVRRLPHCGVLVVRRVVRVVECLLLAVRDVRSTVEYGDDLLGGGHGVSCLRWSA